MTLEISPISARKCASPSVGIFWRIANFLLVDRSTLAEAEPYGDCLTHGGGHYERWEEWRDLGQARLSTLGYPDQIEMSEYDGWPRGRVVYEKPTEQFVVYADRRLHSKQAVTSILIAFSLNDTNWRLMTDIHYR